MKCHEARRLLSPYLDSELLGQEAFEVSRHLEQCPECEQRFEAEARLEALLVEAVAPPLDADAEPQSLAGLVTRRGRPRRTIVSMLVAAVVGLVVGAWFWSAQDDRETRETLAASLLRMHGAVLDGTERPHASTSDRAGVEAFFAGKLDVEVSCPGWLDVRGVRLCALGGEPLALLFARDGGRDVSVFTASRRLLDAFPAEREALVRGETVTRTAGASRVVIALHGPVVAAAAGAVDEGLLLRVLEESE